MSKLSKQHTPVQAISAHPSTRMDATKAVKSMQSLMLQQFLTDCTDDEQQAVAMYCR